MALLNFLKKKKSLSTNFSTSHPTLHLDLRTIHHLGILMLQVLDEMR